MDWTLLQLLALVERELLLFAGLFFLIGAIDELLVDGLYLWLRLSGRCAPLWLDRGELGQRRLEGWAAVFIPAWQEHRVIGHTLAHALSAWRQRDFVIYVGIYRNDMATLEAAMQAVGADPRVRLVVHDCDGPSTKADCLNRLYRALEVDESRTGRAARMVVLHDAEDMVDPAELGLMDLAVSRADMVQLPVLPLPQQRSRWVGSHYCEEFAEAHAKTMVVRDWLGACLPAAGVGCAIGRGMLRQLAATADARTAGPFATGTLTEDYELGMRVRSLGGRARFVRARGHDGALIATRALFPARLDEAVRQKARWVHGIALQGWERLGWGSGLAEAWMRLRDRRGPMAALVMACGYAFFLVSGLCLVLDIAGLVRPWHPDPFLSALVWANLAAFAWRAAWRCAFTAREHGLNEGLRAVLRIPVTNVIAILAARRALLAYVASLRGVPLAWDKTPHDAHPAAFALTAAAAVARSPSPQGHGRNIGLRA